MKTVSIYETGCVRKNNEDLFLILPEVSLFAVADGMGGHKAGEIASSLAIAALVKKAPVLSLANTGGIQQWMKETIEEANTVIYEKAISSEETTGMGTTLTALVTKENKAVIGHVGDSRIYLWRDGVFSLLSEDHSMVNELVRLGQLTEEKAKNHPHKNVLSRALGVEKYTFADCFQIEIQQGDVFLLCTDGFSNSLLEEEIAAEFSSPGTWDNHMENLKNLVLERGAPDNFTAVCCLVE